MHRIQQALAQHAALARRLNAEYEAASVGVDANGLLQERDLRRLIILAPEEARTFDSNTHPFLPTLLTPAPPPTPVVSFFVEFLQG